jgi:hypothetical protein
MSRDRADGLSVAERKRRRDAVERAYSQGYWKGGAGPGKHSAMGAAAQELKISRQSVQSFMRSEQLHRERDEKDFLPDDSKFKAPKDLRSPGTQWDPAPLDLPQPSWIKGHALELVSNKKNEFLFGAAGDLHAASKYTRWDVREELYKHFINEGAVCNFDTGNWIDGEAPFNRYDIETHGLDAQCQLLAKNHPKGLPTYAIWGDDHEGWYASREGIDVGQTNERIMQAAGHDWTDIGFMEAHVKLINANSGKVSNMSIVHPGMGASYALSYAVQKIIESLEGGEKPAVAHYGHFHKIWAGTIRNVWVSVTGCQCDQTPYLRKKRIEVHVGGNLIRLRQDPRDGSIISMRPELIRYFAKPYYSPRRWSKHGSVTGLPRMLVTKTLREDMGHVRRRPRSLASARKPKGRPLAASKKRASSKRSKKAS